MRTRVLLMEDDESQAALIRKKLQQAFFDVTVCQDVGTGLRLSEEQKFVVAIVDLDLGGTSGFDFVRGLNRIGINTKVILHSVDSTFESAKDGLNLGVFAYVEKGRLDNQLIEQCHRAAAAYLSDNLDVANEEIAFQLRLLEAVDHGIIATNTDGSIVYWNRFSENLTGFSQIESMGKSIFDFLLLEPNSRQLVQRQIQSGGTWQGECKLRMNSKGSEPIFVRLVISVLPDSRGIIMGSVISYHDLTEAKKNEQRLEQRANLLAINAELGRLAVVISDRDTFLQQVIKKIDDGLSLESGRVLLTNAISNSTETLASVGLKSRAASGKIQLIDVDKLQLGESIDGFRIPLHENENLIGCIEGEFHSTRIVGQKHRSFLQSVSSLVSGVLLRNWATHLWQLSEKLISEKQDQLTHAQRTSTLGQIAATLAHEINQPLGAICNFSGGLLYGLKKSGSTDSELSETLELIHGEATKAGVIVNRLRKYLTLDAFQLQRMDVNTCIHDTLKILKNLLSNANAVTRLELDSSGAIVEADPIRIQQVLVNVIKNSVEAIQGIEQTERFVRITTSTADNWVQICILDNGPALANSEIADLFKPYHTTKPGGLGMGLCISRSIIEQHQRSMNMTQMIPNGMLTTIRIPAAS
ncbi:ATP-binding protein [Pirellulaceae bacterium SH449]